MVKPLDNKGRLKWYGFLANIEAEVEFMPLSVDLIRNYASAWKGDLVDPQNSRIKAIIDELTENGIFLKLPERTKHLCPFEEIINSGKIIHYWLKKGLSPESVDFREPNKAISVPSISNNSYAPRLAERIRREIKPPAFALPEEILLTPPLYEGAAYSVIVNAYERNMDARSKCIAHYGATCIVCGFNFAETYGSLADGFIHVHHIKPLSEIGKEYNVDPILDLRPVCPNCHAVIHLHGKVRSIEDVKREIIKKPNKTLLVPR